MDTLKVRDAGDVEQVVRAALANEQPLEIIGRGSKRSVGQPMATNAVLDLSTLNAVTSYEPNELIITVEAGAPLADVLSLIDSKNQQFAFEPMDTAPLLGTSDMGTVGGMIGAGLAGPRRIKAGGARDHLLGAQAVSGFGDSFKAGGKVVKNVTGYDLCKLLAGSWGTLAVMTEVTLKVMPKPETECTLLLRGLDDATANRAMTTALGSPFDVSAAAHVPASAFRGGDGCRHSRSLFTPAQLRSAGQSAEPGRRCRRTRRACPAGRDRLLGADAGKARGRRSEARECGRSDATRAGPVRPAPGRSRVTSGQGPGPQIPKIQTGKRQRGWASIRSGFSPRNTRKTRKGRRRESNTWQ